MGAAATSRRWHRPILAAVAIVALILSVAAWLVASESGLRAACSLAEGVSGGRLTLAPAGGSLLGPLRLAEADWQEGGGRIRLQGMHLDWQPRRLLEGRLQVTNLAAEELSIVTMASAEPPRLPASLRLPVDVGVTAVRLGKVLRDGSVLAENVTTALEIGGGRYRLLALGARIGGIALQAQGELAADAPFALQASGELHGQLAERPMRLAVVAAGDLAAIDLRADSREGPLQGMAQGRLTPFAAQLFSHLKIDFRGLDPAAWVDGAPQADLDLVADLIPEDGAPLSVVGPFSLRNRLAGPFDRERLPMTAVTGQLRWQEGEARVDLALSLTGGGSLSGQGRWQGGAVALDLHARHLDAATLHSRLQPTRLAGSIEGRIERESQQAAVDLAEPRFSVQANATRVGSRVAVESLRIQAGTAGLVAHGSVDLGEARAFVAEGELQRFNPARFVRVPAARINARFAASGSLHPRWAAQGHFELRDSQWAGQPLAGSGDLDLLWPQVRKADIRLAAGANRLTVRGAFGAPGQTLVAELAAPALAAFGLEGGIGGNLRLGGTLASPAGELHLESERLAVAGKFRLQGLLATASAGSRPSDPLRIDVRLGTLGTPDQPALLKSLQWTVSGTRQSHELAASAAVAGRGQLSLTARGGLAEPAGGPAWAGTMTALTWQAAAPGQSVRLQQAAPLRLAGDGWSVGPAELLGDGWSGRLQGRAAQGRLVVSGQAEGLRLGRFAGELEAGLQGAWQLERTAPWRGRLQVESPDLAWLGPLLADGVTTGGRFSGDLRLAGTPTQPVTSGQLAGDGLRVHLVDQGLRLERGELRAQLADNRLELSRLAFDSPLQAPPRALRLAAGSSLDELTARPGRLEIKGELRIDAVGATAETAALDVRLERLGVIQSPEQWVMASGTGRVDWRSGGLELAAKLAVDAGYWQLARPGTPQLSDDVVVKRGEGSPPLAARPRLALDVETDLGRHFHFSGAGLQSRLAGSVRLRAEGRDLPRASGTIRTVGGRFDAYGQQLDIVRGILNFSGLLENPSLNVRAVRRGLVVEPGVEVSGTAKRPVVRLVSDPEMADAEKLSWLVLGHGSEQGGAGDASVLLSAAGAILGGESGGVVQQLKRTFGIDDFALRSGQVGDSGSRQATSRVVGSGVSGASAGEQIVSVGKRLSSNVLLSYEQTLGKTESVVKLTVRLTRGVSVVGRAGSDNAVDFFYNFRFGR